MKARRARLASASPNWRYLHGLDTQCWQRIPPFNYGVVTMDTTYSTPISITLHMALCEGHTTSEIQLKASEMKALAQAPHAWWTITGWRSWSNWLLLTSSCHAWARSVALNKVKNWRCNWIMREFNITRTDTSSVPQQSFHIRVHVLLQPCICAFIHEVSVHKHNPVHTLQPQNASIIQNRKFLCLFLLSVFIRYSFCLVALRGATVQGWRISIWFIHFPLFHLHVSLDQTVASRLLQLT